MRNIFLALSVSALLLSQTGAAQKVRTVSWTTNFDESKVPAYTLPDPLVCEDGSAVTTVRQWEKKRRPELVSLLTEYMYGKAPAVKNLGYEVISSDDGAFGGLGIEKVLRVFLTKEGKDGVAVEAHVVSPASATGASPAFMRIGNMNGETVARLLDNGYAAVWYDCTSVAPDRKDSYQEGLIESYFRPGQTYSYPDEWRAIAAWAWTASRILDCLEHEKSVDASKVAIIGHSRLGKTALWAGAVDRRFALVIPAGSGCCGAALSRRAYGETLFDANDAFPHWFCGNFQQFSFHEATMPFDQHEVIALCAPRPVYIAAAEDDQWADPRGEYLAGRAASPVYALYGVQGLASASMPAVDAPDQNGRIAYHIRKGGHSVNGYDWEQFIIFADKWLK